MITPGAEIDIWDESNYPLWVRVCAFLETLYVTEGSLQGEPLVLLPFQIDYIKKVCDPDLEIIAMTMPRGNGKTTLNGAIAAAAMVGPLMVKNTEIPVVATDKAQANIAARHALQFMEPWRQENGGPISFTDNNNQGLLIRNRLNNIALKPVSADPKSKHGASIRLGLGDEPAQWSKNEGEKVFNAVVGSLGKQKDGKFCIIGTKPDSEHHFFSKVIKAGLSPEGRKSGTYAVEYASAPNTEYDDIAQLEKANPLWHHVKSLRDTITADIRRVKDGTLSKGYMLAYRHNLGCPEGEDVEYLLNLDNDPIGNWKRCVMPRKELNEKHPREGLWFGSFDPGGSASMTAFTAYWPETGRFEAYAGLPNNPDIEDRERTDKVDVGTYTAALERGELKLFHGKETPLKDFVDWVATLMEGAGDPEAIYTDKYKFLAMEQAVASSMPSWVHVLEERRVGRGEDGTNDIECFEKEVYNGSLKSAPSILMLSALRETRLQRTTTGYVGLDKSGSRARIDVVQAGILSVGAGHRWKNPDTGARADGIDSYIF